MGIPAIVTENMTASDWVERRKELLDIFSHEVYGITPDFSSMETRCSRFWEMKLTGGILYETYRLFFLCEGRECSMRFEIWRRQDAEQKLPCVLMIDVFDSNPDIPGNVVRTYEQLPYDRIVQEGYAAVYVHAADLCSDDPRTCRRGILEYAGSGRKENDNAWGAVGAWAWGVSRVIDFLCADERFDKEKIAVAGCSRAGKTALWCGAQDERVRVVISCVSGCTGAAVTRGKTGERVRDITEQFPHWMCRKYASYADAEEQMPFDQHMLLALCAPRPLYVSSASEDSWADPKKEFESCVLAGEIYRLLGKRGLSREQFPEENTPIMEGDVAYHVRKGAHGCRLYDWEQYLRFLRKYFQA